MTERSYDVAVVGGGVAGRAIALGLVRVGAEVALIDAAPPVVAAPVDGRTTALLQGAVRLLERLGVWSGLHATAAPLRRLRIVDLPDDGRAPRADVTFAATELGLHAFGYNVANAALAAAIDRELGGIDRIEARLVGLDVGGERVRLELDSGRTVAARLVIGADGKRSQVRAAVGIGARRHDYGQTAIVTAFGHRRPHVDTSIELHRPGGPFTMVPLAPGRSSLVWVEPTPAAQHLLGLDEQAFAHSLDERVRPWLGPVHDVGRQHGWPLHGVLAHRLAAPRVLLAGEAAHAVSPLGAQGYNLSLRDAATLVELIGPVLARGGDPGRADTVLAYERRRQGDVTGRFWAVDGLNRLVRSDLKALGFARSLGLDLVGRLPPLRRGVMRALLGDAALTGTP